MNSGVRAFLAYKKNTSSGGVGASVGIAIIPRWGRSLFSSEQKSTSSGGVGAFLKNLA